MRQRDAWRMGRHSGSRELRSSVECEAPRAPEGRLPLAGPLRLLKPPPIAIQHLKYIAIFKVLRAFRSVSRSCKAAAPVASAHPR